MQLNYKIVGIVGVIAILGVVYYNYVKRFKNAILKLPFVSPDYYKTEGAIYLKDIQEKFNKGRLTEQDRLKYKAKFESLYKIDVRPFIKEFQKDAKEYKSKQNNPILETLLIIPRFFNENPASFFNSFIWIKANIKSKMQFSSFLEKLKKTEDKPYLNAFLEYGSNNFLRNLYTYLIKLPKI
jgi:hypothetical protein